MNRIRTLLTRGIIAAGIACAWHFTPLHAAAPALASGCTLVQSPSADIAPSSGFSTPAAIVASFDNARLAEGCSTTLSIDQSTFGSLSPQQQMLALFNAERQDRGLGTLQLDPTLMSQIDLNHSREMAQYKYFNHPSPINHPGPSNVFARLTVNPAIAGHWTGMAENIAAGYSTSAAAVYAYMYQDSGEAWGHRHNILGSYNWVGIGIASGGTYGIYYSSDFLGGSYTPPAAADTTAPTLSAPAVTAGSAASGGSVTVQVTGVQDTGASSGEAGIGGVVFYANAVTQDSSGNANTVPATSMGNGVWQATMSVPAGAVIHAVAVDGSGNYTDCATGSTTCAAASTGGGSTGGSTGGTTTPTVGLSPSSGGPRTVTTASVSGFRPSETIYLYWDSTSTSPIATGVASSTGTLVRGFYIPVTTNGQHTVIAVGLTSHSTARATYTVKPRVVLTYTYGAHGLHDTMTAYGFTSGETITVHWASPTGTVLGTGSASTTGTGTVLFTVPTAPIGTYSVYASGSNGSSASATFRITS